MQFSHKLFDFADLILNVLLKFQYNYFDQFSLKIVDVVVYCVLCMTIEDDWTAMSVIFGEN